MDMTMSQIEKIAIQIANDLKQIKTRRQNRYIKTMTNIKLLKANKAKVFALEQTQNSISLENFDFKNSYPIALILGNEVDGVQQELINLCDGCIEIPQFGSKHSLNVAVSAGIAIWHLACQQLQHGLIFESGASLDE